MNENIWKNIHNSKKIQVDNIFDNSYDDVEDGRERLDMIYDNIKRLISAGSGLIFKGSGFYLTDYKKKSSKTDNKNKSNKEA